MEKENLKKIIALSDSIRRKYLALKRGDADTEHVLQKTFKPIVRPLETLVQQAKDQNKSKKFVDEDETRKKIKLENNKIELQTPQKFSKVNILKSEQIAESSPSVSVEEVLEEAIINPDRHEELNSYLDQYGHISRNYLLLYIANDEEIDKKSTYRLRYANNQWMIGNIAVTIDNNDFIIGENTYEGTPGLYELIFMKTPDESKISETDISNYVDILFKTKAIYRFYSSNQQIQGNRTEKYKKYIAPYVRHRKGSTKEGEALKDYVDAKPHYVYWNNINELVQRLRLLYASKYAGHSGHDNEIIAILEELREEDIIY